jgi:hypothetical protein
MLAHHRQRALLVSHGSSGQLPWTCTCSMSGDYILSALIAALSFHVPAILSPLERMNFSTFPNWSRVVAA